MEHPPVQNLIAPARNVAFGIVAGSDELVSKGLQSGNLLLLRASGGVRSGWARQLCPPWTAGLAQSAVILGDQELAGAGSEYTDTLEGGV